MKLILEVKQRCNFFWLRAIRNVRIDKCCAQCFIGEKYNEVYEKTHFKDKALVELDIEPDIRVKAYYLCGLSCGFVWGNNTHVAFVPCKGKNIDIENDKIKLQIIDAREIHFQDYVPHPEGFFTKEQRSCRNWIFANYIKDGMPL